MYFIYHLPKTKLNYFKPILRIRIVNLNPKVDYGLAKIIKNSLK